MGISNLSSKATTIKEMYQLMESDTWNIDKCLEYCNYDGACIVQTDVLLDKYYTYFEQFLIKIDLDPKYYYKPQEFAADYYGDPELDFLVLYFAKIKSLFEFNKPQITVLDYTHLRDINQLFTAYKKHVNDNKKNPPEFKQSDIAAIKTSVKYIKEK